MSMKTHPRVLTRTPPCYRTWCGNKGRGGECKTLEKNHLFSNRMGVISKGGRLHLETKRRKSDNHIDRYIDTTLYPPPDVIVPTLDRVKRIKGYARSTHKNYTKTTQKLNRQKMCNRTDKFWKIQKIRETDIFEKLNNIPQSVWCHKELWPYCLLAEILIGSTATDCLTHLCFAYYP